MTVNGKVRFRGVVNPALLERLLVAESQQSARASIAEEISVREYVGRSAQTRQSSPDLSAVFYFRRFLAQRSANAPAIALVEAQSRATSGVS